jgi:hypothetical protein
MNARFVALATVLDVVVLVGLGVGIFIAPLTLVWAFDDGFSTDLATSWGVAVDGWLLGHGVPLAISVPKDLADSLALGTLGQRFRVDVALLGVALLTVLWGYRIGSREETKRHPLLTWMLSIGVMVALSWMLVLSSPGGIVSIELMDALVRPALFLAAGLALATWAGPNTAGRTLLRERMPTKASAILRSGFAAGMGSLAGMLGVAALTVAGLLVVSWVPVISLYESLQPGAFGIVALSIAQLALLPTVVVWAFSWLVGPGFALGVGAMVSPLGTTLQAVPALPLAGILALDVPAWSLAVMAVPLVVAFTAGLASRTRLLGRKRGGLWRTGDTTSFDEQPLVTILFTALLAAGVAAGAGAILSSLASGGMGPGRFIEVGPDPAQIALWWGVEVLFGVLLGLLSGGLSGSRSDTRR